jgi:hypothetical protein
MAKRHIKAIGMDGQEKEEKTAASRAGTGSEDACRCKEVAEMKPRQLFGLMLSDLAFWKKKKKG